MKPDPMAPYFPAFMISWLALGIGGWIWLWTRPSAAQKRLWHRRFAIAAGLIFGAFLTFTLLIWHQPFALLIFLPFLVLHHVAQHSVHGFLRELQSHGLQSVLVASCSLLSTLRRFAHTHAMILPNTPNQALERTATRRDV